jgi:hypothetical protein
VISNFEISHQQEKKLNRTNKNIKKIAKNTHHFGYASRRNVNSKIKSAEEIEKYITSGGTWAFGSSYTVASKLSLCKISHEK